MELTDVSIFSYDDIEGLVSLAEDECIQGRVVFGLGLVTWNPVFLWSSVLE